MSRTDDLAIPAPPGDGRPQGLLRLRCSDAHPVPCDVTFESPHPDDLIAFARTHGASAHGFTPSWYTPARVAAMSGVIRG